MLPPRKHTYDEKGTGGKRKKKKERTKKHLTMSFQMQSSKRQRLLHYIVNS